MATYIDKKYVSLLAPKLSQFKQRGEFLWNFRCPVCGDSTKNQVKARGYIYKRKENFGFMCHNCGTSMNLAKFIKYVDPTLYNEYQLESFGKPPEKKDDNEEIDKLFRPQPKSVLEQNADKISSLTKNNAARKYLEDRKVPIEGLFYTDDFSQFVRNVFPDETKTLYKEARIIIPFYDRNGDLLGVQGRAIGPSKVKYITVKAHEDAPKIFGLDRVDTSKTVYVVEGPIDSLFIRNSVATMDAALYHAASLVGLDFNYIFVYDNEPRNKQIVSNMRKTIALGRKLCIWPSEIKEKDINEMVLAGMHPSVIQHIIDSNTHEGMMATLKMNQWEKTV